MSIFKTFIIMLIGVLLMPALASGIATVLVNTGNVTGTPAAAIIGTILTIYAVAILYGGAKGVGLI